MLVEFYMGFCETDDQISCIISGEISAAFLLRGYSILHFNFPESFLQ